MPGRAAYAARQCAPTVQPRHETRRQKRQASVRSVLASHTNDYVQTIPVSKTIGCTQCSSLLVLPGQLSLTSYPHRGATQIKYLATSTKTLPVPSSQQKTPWMAGTPTKVPAAQEQEPLRTFLLQVDCCTTEGGHKIRAAHTTEPQQRLPARTAASS